VFSEDGVSRVDVVRGDVDDGTAGGGSVDVFVGVEMSFGVVDFDDWCGKSNQSASF
jgi:hypothetical protein